MAQWMIYTKKADFNKLGQDYGITPVTARIMINRGVLPEEFESFLRCDISRLHSPWLFKDMELSVNIITHKLKSKKKIRIIGDYDIDGVCATYILASGISEIGGVVDIDIPDRVKDGYGINKKIIDKAADEGVDTIITCDNGISAIEEIDYAAAQGLTVIVTDHHEVPVDEEGNYIRVKGNAVINHKQPDCGYPYKNLCGAAVAYKLMEALYEKAGIEYNREKYLVPAAIATIGDVVDLDGENRIIAKNGLKLIKNTSIAGLKALTDVCGIDVNNISSYHIGFILGPCLNAGGRIETAKIAYRLLAEKSYERAYELAEELKELNDKRKIMTDKGVEAARLKALEKADKNVLILYIGDIHESIAGIVAGRIREQFYKPVVIFTDSEEPGMVKGSGRSIKGYDMFKEMSKCRFLFAKFGGHEMAAGLSMKKENIETFDRLINENENMTKDILTEKLWIDVKMPFSYITEAFVDELSVLEPFGKGNEKPVFAQKPVELVGFNIMGKNRNVLKMTLKDIWKYPIQALYFGDIEALEKKIKEKYGDEEFRNAKMGMDNEIRLCVAYYPQINTYKGKTTVQIVVKEVDLQA